MNIVSRDFKTILVFRCICIGLELGLVDHSGKLLLSLSN
jgi:hypothetical protein